MIGSWRGDRISNILLLFAGKTDLNNYKWEIRQEMIKSAYTGKLYPRINPVIRYSNGVVCSISYAASFTLINNDDGVINKDGSFRFTHPKDLQVKISYKNEEKSNTISYRET